MMANERPFRFGVINEMVLPGEEWFSQVQRVEALGYDTFLIRDHFLPDFFGDQLAPIAALAMAAAVTERLRVGTLVFSNDYRHPVLLAKELATIDWLSGGRLEVGIGAGWLRKEYEQAGLPYARAGERIARLEESLRVLRGLWSNEPFCFEGEHYSIEGIDGQPKPLQRPHPPILIGAGQPKMLQLAGREADIVGILTTSVASGTVEDDPNERTAAGVEQKLAHVRAGAGARYDQIELSLIPTIITSTDRERTTAELIATRGWRGVTVSDVLAMPSMLIGAEAEICDDLELRREQYGFSYYVISDEQFEAFAPVVARLGGR
jgi:probable F420-dependent oxidoreductase